MADIDSRAELPAHTPGTPRGEEMVRRLRPRAGPRGPGARPHGAGLDEHQRRGPRPDRPADAAPAAGLRPAASRRTIEERTTPWIPIPSSGGPGLTAAGLAPPVRAAEGRPRAVRAVRRRLADDHAHLVEPASRRLACACDACAILFSDQGGDEYRRVPRRVRLLPDFRLTDEAWEGLQLPINLAFFLHSTPAGRVVALYPSPAGATESLVAPEAWRGAGGGQPGPARLRAGRRGAAGQPGRRGARVLPRRHRRVLPAGRPDPHALARACRAGRRSGTRSAASSPT